MSDQLRAARAILRLNQWDTAQLANVPVYLVRQIEAADGRPVAPAIMDRIRVALEQAGVEFIPDGIRRRRPARPGAASFEDLRAISLRSAEQLRGHAVLTDADLYDQDGLPA